MINSRARSGWRSRVRSAPWLVSGVPWWLGVLLGAVLIAAGAVLITRPLSALAVLGLYVGASCVISGIADLLGGQPPREAEGANGRRLAAVVPWLWIVGGIVIAVWLGRRVDLFGPAVAVLLLVSGTVDVVRWLLARTVDRFTAALFGVAQILFGLLALLWPDATLVVIGVLFGGRTVLFGILLIVRGIRTRAGADHTSGRRRWRTGLRLTAAVAVLALAVTTTWASSSLRAGAGSVDAFYDTPSTLPATPGVLIRTEPYLGNLPAGMAGWRLYYTTTDAQGRVVPSSGVLVAPADTSRPAPLITWAHGTVGIARPCAPSLRPDAIGEPGVPAADVLAREGWAMVATDYPGMGAEGQFPYLVGQGESRAVLDAARAARQVNGAFLGPQTVIWGHSQGGHAALWAGQLAQTYAPDLDVVGTAALSPASNPRALADAVLANAGAPGASLGISFVLEAYSRYYPGVSLDDLIDPSAREIVREAAARCTSQGATLVTVLTGLSIADDIPIVKPGALQGSFAGLLDENIPRGPWNAPLFIGQGEADEVINFSINQAYVAQLCAAGTNVEFKGYPGGTHMSVIAAGSSLSDDLVRWTQDRLARVTAVSTCAP